MENDEIQSSQEDIVTTQPGVGFPSAEAPRKKKTQVPVLFIIIPLFLVILGGLAFFVFRGAGESPDMTEELSNVQPTVAGISTTETPTPLPTATTTSTPLATASSAPVSKGSVSVRVLNGTGVPGEAAYLQTQLKSLGYSSIDVGNASNQSATQTEIVYLSTVSSSLVTELETKLKPLYTSVVSREGTPTGGKDIEITTGPRKNTGSTATATPKSSSTPAGSATPRASSTPTATPRATQ